jgi:hypothetical protein
MVWPFSRRPVPHKLPTLPFKSGEGFFKYQCKYGYTDIVENEGMVALVLDPREQFGTQEAVRSKKAEYKSSPSASFRRTAALSFCLRRPARAIRSSQATWCFGCH